MKITEKSKIPLDIEKNINSKVLLRLIKHLQERTDVQNVDLMNLSGFCRNCLSKWYSEAANDEGYIIEKNKSREIIYGMPHDEWKKKYQKEASKDQLKKFNNISDD
tara:strand:- start:75 stop:392 length:318 start_codon:yes stop_codon:yes gene_type:complete